MPLLPTLGRTVGTGIKAVRLLVRGSVRGSAWATRRVGSARARGAANEIGMIRLFDLHALSCAGDTLIAIGLAGTIFFNVPLGEARSKVALYLLITMVPFTLLAPVVGPLLDHFRHGRRWALAATMLGRAFLAYVISDHLFGWGLYPAAFGVLALSRAYGVARSAAVPRLLPEGVALSQVGARASVYGTFAGAVVAPVGLLAFRFGPQWPLRVATITFVVGMVIALRLPPRADSDPPEAVPRPWRAMLRLGRGEDRPLSGRLVIATLIGSAGLRLLYGFLLLFLAFVIMGNQLDTTVLGTDIGRQGAVGLIGGALAVGTFLSTAVGTRLRIRRPLALQSAGLTIAAGVAVLSAVFYNLAMLTLLALLTAVFSGISKLTVDASIQERVPERLRASAFAHSETVLMIAWVAGGALGIVPLPGRLGVALAAALVVAAAIRAAYAAVRLHNERLSGRSGEKGAQAEAEEPDVSERIEATGPRAETVPGRKKATVPGQKPETVPGQKPETVPGQKPETVPGQKKATGPRPEAVPGQKRVTGAGPKQEATSGRGLGEGSSEGQGTGGRGQATGGRRWRPGRRQEVPSVAAPPSPAVPPPAASPEPEQTPTPTQTPAPAPAVEPQPDAPDSALAPPGYHVYRPSMAPRPTPNGRSPEDDR